MTQWMDLLKEIRQNQNVEKQAKGQTIHEQCNLGKAKLCKQGKQTK